MSKTPYRMQGDRPNLVIVPTEDDAPPAKKTKLNSEPEKASALPTCDKSANVKPTATVYPSINNNIILVDRQNAEKKSSWASNYLQSIGHTPTKHNRYQLTSKKVLPSKENTENVTKNKETVKISPIKPPILSPRKDIVLNLKERSGKQHISELKTHKIQIHDETKSIGTSVKSQVFKANRSDCRSTSNELNVKSVVKLINKHVPSTSGKCFNVGVDLRTKLSRQYTKTNRQNKHEEQHNERSPYRKTPAKPNLKRFIPDENLIISFNPEEDTKDDTIQNMSPIKSKAQNTNPIAKTESKCKKIKLEINIIFQNSDTEPKIKKNNDEAEDSGITDSVDLSFLDDFDVDGIVECLKECANTNVITTSEKHDFPNEPINALCHVDTNTLAVVEDISINIKTNASCNVTENIFKLDENTNEINKVVTENLTKEGQSIAECDKQSYTQTKRKHTTEPKTPQNTTSEQYMVHDNLNIGVVNKKIKTQKETIDQTFKIANENVSVSVHNNNNIMEYKNKEIIAEEIKKELANNFEDDSSILLTSNQYSKEFSKESKPVQDLITKHNFTDAETAPMSSNLNNGNLIISNVDSLPGSTRSQDKTDIVKIGVTSKQTKPSASNETIQPILKSMETEIIVIEDTDEETEQTNIDEKSKSFNIIANSTITIDNAVAVELEKTSTDDKSNSPESDPKTMSLDCLSTNPKNNSLIFIAENNTVVDETTVQTISTSQTNKCLVANDIIKKSTTEETSQTIALNSEEDTSNDIDKTSTLKDENPTIIQCKAENEQSLDSTKSESNERNTENLINKPPEQDLIKTDSVQKTIADETNLNIIPDNNPKVFVTNDKTLEAINDCTNNISENNKNITDDRHTATDQNNLNVCANNQQNIMKVDNIGKDLDENSKIQFNQNKPTNEKSSEVLLTTDKVNKNETKQVEKKETKTKIDDTKLNGSNTKQKASDKELQINTTKTDCQTKQVFQGAYKELVENLEKRMLKYFDLKYTITSIIRKGAFSDIFQCKNDNVQTKYAVKILNKASDSYILGFEKQKMLMRLQAGVPTENLNCVRLIKGFSMKNSWCFLMEYYPKNLSEVLSEKKHYFHINDVQNLSRQLISAVTVLRNNNIIHSDIKPSHILINSTEDRIKLCGFDQAFYFHNNKLLPNVGTVNYRAPELILGYYADYSIDVWSTALVMYEMATKMKLFPGFYNNDILYKHICTLGKIPNDMFQRSEFRHLHYNGQTFCRRLGQNGQHKQLIHNFKQNNKLRANILNVHNKHYGRLQNSQKAKDKPKLYSFIILLEKMLNIHPRYRLAIEFAYANPFIYEVFQND